MRGVITALTSPMLKDGSLDTDSFKRAVEYQIDSGVKGIVVTGTTGEVSGLSVEEHIRLVRLAKEQAQNRIPIVAGSGSNSTEEAIELTRCIRRVGILTSLQVVPYYVKPTQEGLYWHFRKLSEAVDVDVILYNVPSRTGASLTAKTVSKLSQIPNIIGIKDTNNNAALLHKLIRKAGGNLLFYSGDDLTSFGACLMGGAGVISVLSNLFPKLIVELHSNPNSTLLTQRGSFISELFNLCSLLFAETNPIPIKWAVNQSGLGEWGTRLPLTSYHKALRPFLLESLVQFGLVRQEGKQAAREEKSN
ncbi:dihydrodipicolinate synthase [Candidatus Tremblaya phenacola PAVE]|nr:dihydrodipicolinate synthase [Candidatus Tremblaya phenacola PAVE]